MVRTRNKFLMFTSIFMIITGVITMFFAAYYIFEIIIYTQDSFMVSKSFIAFLSILDMAGGIISLIAGILGIINASKPEQAMTLIILGIFSLVILVISNITDFVGSGADDMSIIIRATLWPILYISAAFQHKELAE